ncbi:MAG TPA: hypothetical protein VGG51_12255 [Candidatus Cybelea sp.]|jgi:hypothetical protein
MALSVITFSLSLTGCHGSAPAGGTGYLPADVSSAAGSIVNPDKNRGIQIESSCGKRVHIVLLGSVSCKFKERGYAKGVFKLYNREKGLVSVSPDKGTEKTTFTVSGLLVGRGSFLVRDNRGHHLAVHTRVSL